MVSRRKTCVMYPKGQYRFGWLTYCDAEEWTISRGLLFSCDRSRRLHF